MAYQWVSYSKWREYMDIHQDYQPITIGWMILQVRGIIIDDNPIVDRIYPYFRICFYFVNEHVGMIPTRIGSYNFMKRLWMDYDYTHNYCGIHNNLGYWLCLNYFVPPNPIADHPKTPWQLQFWGILVSWTNPTIILLRFCLFNNMCNYLYIYIAHHVPFNPFKITFKVIES